MCAAPVLQSDRVICTVDRRPAAVLKRGAAIARDMATAQGEAEAAPLMLQRRITTVNGAGPAVRLPGVPKAKPIVLIDEAGTQRGWLWAQMDAGCLCSRSPALQWPCCCATRCRRCRRRPCPPPPSAVPSPALPACACLQGMCPTPPCASRRWSQSCRCVAGAAKAEHYTHCRCRCAPPQRNDCNSLSTLPSISLCAIHVPLCVCVIRSCGTGTFGRWIRRCSCPVSQLLLLALPLLPARCHRCCTRRLPPPLLLLQCNHTCCCTSHTSTRSTPPLRAHHEAPLPSVAASLLLRRPLRHLHPQAGAGAEPGGPEAAH